MANNQTAFNAIIIAVQQNQVTLAPYLLDGDLDFGYQGLTETDVATLANAIKNNTSVRYLELQSNFIGDNGAIAFAQALQVNTGLRELGLSTNSIGASGAGALAQALQVNTALQTLGLNANSISDSGASAIAQALQVNTVLETLSLNSDTSIGDSGASAIAQALQVNTALQWLNLYFNSISDSGASAIAQALQVNTGLQYLNLAFNSISDSGASAIAQALQVNTGLQYLNLALNSISDSGASAFTKALQCNYVLQQLDLDIILPTQLSGYLQRNVNCAAAAAQCPILVFEPPATIFPNTTIPLTPANLRITDVTRTQTLFGNFTVDAVSNGNFVNSTQQILTEFSQAAVNASQVFIKTDSSGLPFSCNITASYGGLSTCAIPLVFNITTTISTTTTPTTTTTSTMPTSTVTNTTTSRPFTATRTPTTNSTASTLPLTTSSSFFSSSTTQSPTTSVTTTSTSAVIKSGGGAKMQSTNLGAIIGGVVGGVAGAAAVGVGMFLLNRRRHHKRTARISALPAHVTRNDVAMTANPVYVGALVNATADESGMTPNSVYAKSASANAGRNLVYVDHFGDTDTDLPEPNKWDPSAYIARPPSPPPPLPQSALPLRKKESKA